MSLNWDLSKIEDYETLCWMPSTREEGMFDLTPVTDALIWATVFVSLGRITGENYRDFHRRLIEFQVVTGEGILQIESSKGKRGNRMPTLKEVEAHIGLATNVSPKTSRQWTSYLGKKVKEEASNKIRNEVKE